ncbi:MAG: Rrf2 family transcriptional regulator [Verrucomicrobiales bacterium]|nr:Rrf2 family transcriptional regulator [Verrucomicrobiales bacterium]MCP5556863.1 Rrf2 family transcriptional regulator [Verrucomicrobiaceae bacterium]
MKLSKKAEYGMRAMVAMGRAAAGTTFSIQDLAANENIPLKFLEQILLVLKNAGLLRSKRGVGGGYQMQRPANDVPLREIVEAIDGPFDPIGCVQGSRPGKSCECGIAGGCGLGRTMSELRDMVQTWLTETTVAHIIAREAPPQMMSFDI